MRHKRRMWSYDVAWAPLEFLIGDNRRKQVETPADAFWAGMPGIIMFFLIFPVILLAIFFLAFGIVGSILTGVRNLIWCHRL